MHPLLARYLDIHATLDVLRRTDAQQPVGEEHRHLVEAARAFPDETRAAVAPGTHPGPEAQHAVLFLATQAALGALREDPDVSPELQRTTEALRQLGAEDDDVRSMLAQVVADEAFSGDEDVDHFDRAWFLETLRDLPRLAALDEDTVAAMLTRFGAEAPEGQHLLRENAARALLGSAWDAGPGPIAEENVHDALEELYGSVGEEGLEDAAAALSALVEMLSKEGLIGQLRTERLNKAIAMALAAGGEDDFDEEEEDLDEDGPAEH